jgi:4-carboxymuconolactone decarboxylase
MQLAAVSDNPYAQAQSRQENGMAKSAKHPDSETELFARGLEVRRAVLGADYVEQSLARADEFMMAFQKLATEYCWGEIWTRPGLDRKQRSMLNLAMLTALNKPHELALHVRGALTNGVSREEIREILLQATIYCGIPSGLEAFRTAVEVFREVDGRK